jgi:hypothetical protein
MRLMVLVAVAAALAGCAGMESSSTTYIRADGQYVSKEQLDADQSSCSSSGERTERCMLAKGYFLVAVQDAAVKQAQFAQIAEEKKKREEARLAEERKQQEELARAARRQAKKKKTLRARTFN